MGGSLGLADAVAELQRRYAGRKLLAYRPYPKQYEFHAAGKKFRERAFLAGNQLGKSYCGAYEAAMHATGQYPDWWPGIRFDRPVLIWCFAETNEKSREVIQHALLGTESVDLRDEDMGTGALPRDCIVKITKRQAGIPDVADQIWVKHVSGGKSRLALKVYAQGPDAAQGKKVDFVWLDEEPDGQNAKIYSEALTRTQAVDDGRMIITRTPLYGMTQIIKQFMQPENGDAPRFYCNMTLDECVGGVWPEGTPWAGQEWKGHYSADKVSEIVAGWPSHERKCRRYGVPIAGEGLVFPIDEDEYKVNPFQLDPVWRFKWMFGCDFGMDHPAAGAKIAYDEMNDTIYVVSVYRKSNETPVYHAAWFKAMDPTGEIPIAWPHDGLQRGKADGTPLKDQYRRHGVRMMKESARYDDEKGGAQPVEPIVNEILERMKTSRFKVFSTCGEFFEEARSYHREDGKIVPKDDDVLKAVMYAVMELRHARAPLPPRRARPMYARPIVGGYA